MHTHNVVYDYKTNGGIYAELDGDSVDYGNSVDMSVEAFKDGWEFVGWNTNPDAKEKLETLTMGEEDILLYAIYKKDITANFVDIKEGQIESREKIVTIYNRETQSIISVPKQNNTGGWECLGWSFDTEADASVDTSAESMLKLIEDVTLYGCYIQEITISYDTNGSSEEVQQQIGKRYLNASGNFKNPQFILAKAPNLQKHSFVLWENYAETGEIINTYEAEEYIEIEKNMQLIAKWDRFPEIEAYDRYFTLEDALCGKITQQELLKKVVARDKEDGILNNESDVMIENYVAEEFTNLTQDTDIKITYIATDSFGNRETKTVTVHIVDTIVKINPVVKYIRFISKDFCLEETELVSAGKGGLEENSIWRINETYRNLLEKTLSNSKLNQIKKTVQFLDISTDVIDIASGEWNYQQETWVFTYEDIKNMETFTETYGLGNINVKNGLELFKKNFKNCRQ